MEMIALILSFFTAHIGTILTILAGGGALIVTWFHGKSAGVQQQAVKTQAVQTQLDQRQAAEQVATAQGKADAAQAVGVAMQDRAQAQTDTAALAPGAAQAELQANWSAKE
jgi:hypothetical protein